MYRIVSKEQFSEKVFRLRVEAPLIAKAYRAGNFVIIRVGDKGERIPLTIAHADAERGIITLDELKETWMNKLADNCLFISAREKQTIENLKEIIYKKVCELHVQKYPYNDFLYQTYDEEAEN